MNRLVVKPRYVGLLALALMVPVLVMGGDKGPVISSTAALKLLKDGNARFVSGKRQYPNQGMERLEETKKGQHPFVTILSCSDSRVSVEHIFDAGIGDIFIIRVAGNVSGIDEIATMEYGTEHLHTPLLVVLGHTACGAVTAVTRGDKVGGSIPHLVGRIKPAVAKAKKKEGPEFSEKLLDAAIRLNVWQAIEDLFKKSDIVEELVRENKLTVVGALYHLDTGEVEWLGGHPDQKALMSGAAKSGAGKHKHK
ncbi:MAG: carbonic anhydrase [Spirochaetes bacterium]|nr:carbonic anhydrase [Spirochaetota bacterium]